MDNQLISNSIIRIADTELIYDFNYTKLNVQNYFIY